MAHYPVAIQLPDNYDPSREFLAMQTNRKSNPRTRRLK